MSNKILRLPLFYRLVVLSLSIFCVIISIYLLIFQKEEWPYLIILDVFFALPSMIMFISWSLWKVEIIQDGFIYRNYFGVKHKYNFADLEYIIHPKGAKWYFYKNGKKIICIAYYIENGNMLERAYKKFSQKNK